MAQQPSIFGAYAVSFSSQETPETRCVSARPRRPATRAQLGCYAPTGHRVAATPHAKLRGWVTSPRLPRAPSKPTSAHLPPAFGYTGVWLLDKPGAWAFPSPNTLCCSLPCGYHKPSRCSPSQVRHPPPHPGNPKRARPGSRTRKRQAMAQTRAKTCWRPQSELRRLSLPSL